jgi:hypothetical protein
MRQALFIFFFAGIFFTTLRTNAQQTDTANRKQLSDAVLEKKDSVYVGKKSPVFTDSLQAAQRKRYHRATMYSVILPGAGQVYNKKYWKVPIVFAAIGIPVYAFFYNKSWYQKCQYALTVTINGSTGDSLAKVDPQLLPLVLAGQTNAIITNRDSFRKNQDYSVLFFLLFYGLNILDATVDAHLKDFNVSSDLSFQIKPMVIPGPTPSAGITIAFNLHKPRYRLPGSP